MAPGAREPGGRCGRAPRRREDREGTHYRLLRQDRGAKPAARHVQRQQLRPARINEPGITQATSRSPGAGAGSSGLLLVVHVPDNVGNVLVAVLLLLDKGGVAQGRALEL
jgi:hypothetical protein